MSPDSGLRTSVFGCGPWTLWSSTPVPFPHGPGPILPTQGLIQWPGASPPRTLEGATFFYSSDNKLIVWEANSGFWNWSWSRCHPVCEPKDTLFETNQLEEQNNANNNNNKRVEKAYVNYGTIWSKLSFPSCVFQKERERQKAYIKK